MKKVSFLLILMLISLKLFSQATTAYSLYVENRTNCDQTYVIYAADFCQCPVVAKSTPITIPPGGVHNYPNTMSVPGLGGFPPLGFVAAVIPDGPLACNPPNGIVGQPVCGYPALYSYVSLDAGCNRCTQARAQWFPSVNSCQEGARLLFY